MKQKFESSEDYINQLKQVFPDNPEKWVEHHCSFCGVGAHRAKQMVAGPNKVCICNECAFLAYDATKHCNEGLE